MRDSHLKDSHMRDSHRKVADLGRLLRRSFVSACFASLLLCSQGEASVNLLVFGQATGGTTVTLTNDGSGTSTLSATANVLITVLGGIPQPPPGLPAVETLTATSVGPATVNATTHIISQSFSGTISFTATTPTGTVNYLTATFTDTFSGRRGSVAAGLTASQPPENLTFTSDVIPSSILAIPRGMSLSFTNLDNPLVIFKGSSGASGSTTMSNSGVFSGSIIPEPSTFLSAGLGALGLIGYGIRRRRP